MNATTRSEVSSEERALLSAVRRAPTRDAPRLAYARWLRERGDPRGEFIEAQCAARTAPRAQARNRARATARDLLREHRGAWLERLGLDYGEGVFVRGFVERVVITAERWLAVGARVRRRTPVRSLTLTDCSAGQLARIARDPVLARLRALGVDNKSLGADPLLALLREAPLRKLRRLSVRNQALGARFVTALGALPLALRALALSRNPLGPAGARALAAAPALRGLRALEVYDCELDDEAAAALAGAEFFPALRAFNAFANPFGAAGERALAARGYVASFWQTAPSAGDEAAR